MTIKFTVMIFIHFVFCLQSFSMQSMSDEVDSKQPTVLLLEKLQDPSAKVREHAASALGLLKDIRAFSPLLKILQSTDRDGVRAHAAYGLGLLGNKRAVEPLIKSLRDSSPSIRVHAAMALGLIGDKRALDALNKALKDTSKIVQKEAAVAKEKILNR